MKLTKATAELSKKQITELLKAEVSKSEKMRVLFNSGLDIKEISELLGVRYNFVYNIVSRYILEQRIEGVEKNSNKGSELKDAITKLIEENPAIKVSDVSKQLGKNYNYVWKIMKEIKG